MFSSYPRLIIHFIQRGKIMIMIIIIIIIIIIIVIIITKKIVDHFKRYNCLQ